MTNEITAEVSSDPAPKKRFFIYDNLKFLLILFVVIGHFADQLVVELYGDYLDDPTLPISDFFNKVFIFIYAFHMPLFLFVSGLFYKTTDKLNKTAIGQYLVLGILLKMLTFICKSVFQTDFDSDKDVMFRLLGDDGVFWYLIALAAFVLICYLVRNVNPVFVMIFSVLLSCCIGYDDSIGDEYTLARIINFFPFFYIGSLCSPEKVYRFLKKPILKILAVAVIGIWAFLCFADLELVYPLRMLFTGRSSFIKITEITGVDIQFWHRLLTLAISALLCVAFLAIGINKKIPFITKAGSRTLQVYFWHRLILYFLTYIEYPQLLAKYFPNYYIALYILTAVVLTVILSLKPFGVPLDLVKKAISSKKKVKNNA